MIGKVRSIVTKMLCITKYPRQMAYQNMILVMHSMYVDDGPTLLQAHTKSSAAMPKTQSTVNTKTRLGPSH